MKSHNEQSEWSQKDHRSYRSYRLPAFIVLLFLTITLWSVVGTGQADEKADTPSKADTNAPAATEKAKDDTNNDEMNEEKLIEIFDKFSDQAQKDPDSQDMEALTKKLEEAVKQMQKMQKMPRPDMKRLPATPKNTKTATPTKTDPAKTTTSPKTSTKTVTTSPSATRSKPVAFPRPTLPQLPRPPQGLISKDPNQPTRPTVPTMEPRPTRSIPGVRPETAVNPARPTPAPTRALPTPTRTTHETTPHTTSRPTSSTPVAASPAANAITPTATASGDAGTIVADPTGEFVTIKTQNDIIDVNILLQSIGKQLKLNFIYPDGTIPTGRVKLQQYGQIPSDALLPLLKSVLAFATPPYSMVQEDPYVKILKRTDVLKNTDIFNPGDTEKKSSDESVVVELVELENIDFNSAKAILTDFVPDPTVITTIKNTNLLIITDYEYRIPRLLEIIKLIDESGPEKKLEIITPEYLLAADAQAQVQTLLNALTSQQATQSVTPEGAAAVQPTTPRRITRSRTVPVRQTAPSPLKASSATDKPTLMIDKRTNRLLVIGTEDQITQVKHLLSLLDVPLPAPRINLTPLEVEFISPEEAITQIGSLIEALNAQNQPTGSLEGPGSATPAQPVRIDPRTKKPIQTTPQPNALPTAGGANQAGAYMQADERTKRILVVGSNEQLEQVEDLLALLDIPVPGSEIKLVALDVIHVLPDELSTQISELIEALNEQTEGTDQGTTQAPQPNQPPTPRRVPTNRQRTRSGNTSSNLAGPMGPYMLPDLRTNRIIIVGSQDQIDQVQELMNLLDVEMPGAEIKIKIVTPKYLAAQTAAENISELIQAMSNQETEEKSTTSAVPGQTPGATAPAPQRQQTRTSRNSRTQDSSGKFISTGDEGPILLADGRTNRMFIIGNDDQIEQVMELLNMLDLNIDLKLTPIQIKHVLASDIAQQLSSIIQALTEQDSDSSMSATTTGSTLASQAQNARNSRESRRRDNSNTVSATFINTGEKGPKLLADERTNRLLVVGTELHLEMINNLLPMLDIPPSEYDKMELRIYQPQFVEAAEVIKILDDLEITKKSDDEKRPRDRARDSASGLGGTSTATPTTISGTTPFGDGYLLPGLEEPEIRTAVQETTNRIFVMGTEYQLRDIEEIMDNIDIDPNDALGNIQIYQLENQEPAFIAETLQELLESDSFEMSDDKRVKIPGAEGAPIIVPMEDIFAIAVRGSTKQHKDIKAIIEQLDKRLPQVLIEAIFVQINSDDALKLGINLQNAYDIGGDRGISGVSSMGMTDLTLPGSSGLVGGSGGTVAFYATDLVYARLEALQTQGSAQVISKPRVLVNSNQEASINSKREKPTTKTTIPAGSDSPITEFDKYVDAGTELTITPNISEGRDGKEDFLKLDISLNVNSFDGEGTESIPPAKATNNITTAVTVPNDKIIILGGLTTTTTGTTVNKVPLLGDIPLLGALFRSVTKSETTGVLYVFIKANIVKDENFKDLGTISEENTNKLREFEANYEAQSVVPGIKDKPRKNKRSALDPEDYRE